MTPLSMVVFLGKMNYFFIEVPLVPPSINGVIHKKNQHFTTQKKWFFNGINGAVIGNPHRRFPRTIPSGTG